MKNNLIKIAITMVALLIVVGVIQINTTMRYKNTIKELEEENARLSDPIVQYEIASKEISVAFVKSSIQDIGELATVEYIYTDVGKFEDPAKLFGKEIPFAFTTKSFIAKWDGTIKAGIKVDKLDVAVDQSKREIIIYIPKAEILSHEIDDKSIETLDEKNGLFNPIKVDDIRQFDTTTKDVMENRAIENGLLGKARENAEKIIYNSLVNTGPVKTAEFTIIFKEIAE